MKPLSASGGVGALLQIDDLAAGKVLSATYDGNGNLAGLVNSVTGALEAAYEYDPSGNLLRCEGTYAKSNPFRFSTKWQDDETGLINYGVRYYSPTLGRFINRDPIGEKGGLNLYGFCGNDGVNRTDYLGYFSLRRLLHKIGNFIGGHSDFLTRAVVRSAMRMDNKAFSTLQRNPWVVSAVTTVLSFTPFAWVSPIISAAWTMENGGSLGQVAWAYVGGRISGSIAGGALGSGGGFIGAVARGYLAGGINGGIASYAAGGSFSSGFRNGGYMGAAFAAGAYAYQSGAVSRAFNSIKNWATSLGAGGSSQVSGTSRTGWVKYGELTIIDDDADAPTQFAPYQSAPASQLPDIPAWAIAAGYDNSHSHTLTSQDRLRAIYNDFGRYSNALRTGQVMGNVAGIAAGAGIVAAPVLIGAGTMLYSEAATAVGIIQAGVPIIAADLAEMGTLAGAISVEAQATIISNAPFLLPATAAFINMQVRNPFGSRMTPWGVMWDWAKHGQ